MKNNEKRLLILSCIFGSVALCLMILRSLFSIIEGA
jgi:hypothetical protein